MEVVVVAELRPERGDLVLVAMPVATAAQSTSVRPWWEIGLAPGGCTRQ